MILSRSLSSLLAFLSLSTSTSLYLCIALSPATLKFTDATDISVESPPTYYTLFVDAASSNTWIRANVPYMKTAMSHGYCFLEQFCSVCNTTNS
ncbi:uncharacterized protein HD556DRAFT_1451470 [Suillus plorans]|uniref:Peptidase A1 domain-containing protein n=1 Tax=Suillus plorans TaxID=116603 RepID=A0A9P7A9R7_9AGAM|nr:uncharacterized protein HD556DRAFT_1451470 [Suillus plorans]KAG1784723.1 hypothetical protein HD556DRAFT_1451470 [Suillus plorans]